MLTWLTIFMILFEIWYGGAYLYAYLQTRERVLWLQVVQAVALIALFVYIALTMAGGGQLNGLVLIAMLAIALALNLLWRQGVRSTQLAQSYPRGMLDVLAFRRPVANLKRRVRTK